MIQTFWNGEPCHAVRGKGVVADLPDRSNYWARPLIGIVIPVVRINYNGLAFDIDDRDGSGWAKVTICNGSPSYAHRNVKLRPGTFQPDLYGGTTR